MDYSKYKQLEFRRKVLMLVGAEISITDVATKVVVGSIKMKAWKLKEDVRIYADAAHTKEVFRIQARSIIDFGATYDIVDSASGQPIFSMRRKGLRSTFLRDSWEILDTQGVLYGTLEETSGQLALVRRWVGLIPIVGAIVEVALAFTAQTYSINYAPAGTSTTQLAATITHRKNPFVVKMLLDTSRAQMNVDPRIPIAATALLTVVDASKN